LAEESTVNHHYPTAPAQPRGADGVYLISELSAEVGLEPKTIRFYEREGLVLPTRHGRFKFYSACDVNHLKVIKVLRSYGFPLEKIRALQQLEGTLFKFGQYNSAKSLELMKLQYERAANDLEIAKQRLSDFDHCIENLKAA
jgi:DNA-binding transcriptional MerR regulator